MADATTFQYAKTDGSKGTIQAADSNAALAALKGMSDADPHSGLEQMPAAPVAPAIQQTTTQTRNKANSNATTLTNHMTTLAGGTAGQPSGSVNITRDIDNGDGTRTVTYSDGKTARVTATKNQDGSESYKEIGDGSGTSTSDGTQTDNTDPLTGQVNEANAYAKKQMDFVTTTLDGLKMQGDAATQAMIASIKQMYAARSTEIIDSNSRLLAGKEQNELRTGRSRYLSNVSGGILTDEEQSGVMRLATLQGEMLQEIAKAQKAQTDEDLVLFNDRMDKVGKIKDDLDATIANLHKAALDKQKADLDEKKTNLDMTKTTQDIALSKAKAAAPAIIESLKGLTSAEDKSSFLKEYSDRTGVPIDILMGAVETASNDKAKSDLDLENTRSLINSRYLNDRKTSAALDDEEGGADLKNIINGVSQLSDVDKKKKEAVKAKMQELGFYEDDPPAWFIQGQNAKAKTDQTSEVLKGLWDTYRQKAITDAE